MKTKTTPRDFFLYLFSGGALYFSAITLVFLLWQIINTLLPEFAVYNYYQNGGIPAALRWGVALLIVAFPSYLVAAWWIGKDIDKHPEKKDIWVRKWFIYATLFLASVTLLGDLVFLLYNLLGGDFAVRFILKMLSLGIVAGAVLGYHVFILRREPNKHFQARRLLIIGSSLFVGAALVTGIILAGSPKEARTGRNDQTRIQDLQNIQWQVINFWQQKERLPETLNELVDPAAPQQLPVDPVTQERYELAITGERSFQLCAVFETEQSEDEFREIRQPVYPSDAPFGVVKEPEITTWSHGIGRTCFDREIDPERYPFYSKTQ